jgi:glucokinase
MRKEDPAAVVSRHGLARDDTASEAALELFVSVYGAEAGNLALKFLAKGGVYVAGGIAPRIVEKLTDGTFLHAFRDKPPHTDLLERIPVFVITNPKVGLLGAANLAASQLPEPGEPKAG